MLERLVNLYVSVNPNYFYELILFHILLIADALGVK